ncbi:hypothetical protein LTR17_024505 [Elasticomyces elasticus]|nr:hypothetical protein LTR17_024505 [Elasticomyces elasticus]
MPVDEPHFLTPTGREDEKVLDDLKRSLVDKSAEIDFTPASDTDLLMALKAAVDHISMNLFIHADSLYRQASTDKQYGPMTFTDDDMAFRVDLTCAWDNMIMEDLADCNRADFMLMLKEVKAEVVFLTDQIGRLEVLMEKAKNLMTRFEESGYPAPFNFKAEARSVLVHEDDQGDQDDSVDQGEKGGQDEQVGKEKGEEQA